MTAALCYVGIVAMGAVIPAYAGTAALWLAWKRSWHAGQGVLSCGCRGYRYG